MSKAVLKKDEYKIPLMMEVQKLRSPSKNVNKESREIKQFVAEYLECLFNEDGKGAIKLASQLNDQHLQELKNIEYSFVDKLNKGKEDPKYDVTLGTQILEMWLPQSIMNRIGEIKIAPLRRDTSIQGRTGGKGGAREAVDSGNESDGSLSPGRTPTPASDQGPQQVSVV